MPTTARAVDEMAGKWQALADLAALTDEQLAALTPAELAAYIEIMEAGAAAIDRSWVAQPRQQVAVELFNRVDELLFGGAAGGGKSFWAVNVAIDLCEKHAGIRVLILRRVYPSLQRTIIPVLHRILGGSDRATWNANTHSWTFPHDTGGDSVLECSSLQRDETVYNFSGAEYALIVFEELSEFTYAQFEFMGSRLRSTVPGVVPRMLATANPVGPGARWVRERFVLPPPSEVPEDVPSRVAKTGSPWRPMREVRHQLKAGDRLEVKPDTPWRPRPTKDDPEPKARCYVPSLLTDNPALLANDPGYLARLNAIRDQRRRRGLRLGDWFALDDVEGALWDTAGIEATRVPEPPPPLAHLAVSIDPSGSERGDEVGIVVGGTGFERPDPHLYVVADYSGQYGPLEWPDIALAAYDEWGADRFVIESNFGGAMSGALLLARRQGLVVKYEHASRGKQVRAEPVANLWYLPAAEGGPRAHVVGELPELEEQLCSWVPGESTESPGRLDAMVWLGHHFGVIARPLTVVTGRKLLDRPRADILSGR